MREKLVNYFSTKSNRYILIVSVLMAVMLTLIVVAIMSMFFHGHVTYDYLVTGAIAAFIVASCIVSLNIHTIRKISSAEEILRDREERLRLITDNVRDIIWSLNLETMKMTYVSPSVEQLTGFTVQEFLDQPIEEMLTPESFANAMEMLQEELLMERDGVRGKSDAREIEWEYYHKDGDVMMFAATMSLLHDENGNPQEVIGISRDVTERIRAQDALRKSEEKYRDLVEQIRDVIYATDENGRLTYISPAIKTVLEYDEDQVLGKSFMDIVHQDDIPGIMQRLGEVKQGIIEPAEYRMRLKSGQFKWVRTLSQPQFENGKFAGVRGVLADIHDQKMAEEALRDSEEKYRLLVENQTDLVVKVDLEGSLLFVSPSYCRLFGKTEEELLGTTFIHRIHEEDRDMTELSMRKISRPPHTVYLEQRVMTPSGWRWLAWLDTAVKDENEKVTAIVKVGRDITKLKMVQEDLLKARKLESVRILAGGIAHDFNNILGAVMGNISLAKEDVAPGTELYELLASAEKAALRAREVTERLNAIARKDVPSKYVVVPIPAIIDQAIETVSSRQNIHYDIYFPDDIWTVMYDESQMRHAVENILQNAIEAMPADGVIEIRGENLRITDDDETRQVPLMEGCYVKISVKDHGMGISEENLPRIFDPYFSTKERGVQKGMGLGLASSYAIIKRHNGHIAVDSKVGEGTLVNIYLPAYLPSDNH